MRWDADDDGGDSGGADEEDDDDDDDAEKSGDDVGYRSGGVKRRQVEFKGIEGGD